jgi:peroxiredoxin
MNRLLSISFISLLFLMACDQKGPQSNEVIISGHIQQAADQTLYIEELTTDNLISVDSVKLNEKGRFVFRFQIQEPGFYILKFSRANFITLLLEPGENLELEAADSNLSSSVQIEGSKGSMLLMALNKKLRSNYDKVDSLAAVFRANQHKPDFVETKSQLDLAYTLIFEDQKKYIKQFIDDNPNSLASIIALYQYFGNQVILKENEDFEYFEKLSHSLAQLYPENKHVLDLRQRVSEYKRAEAQKDLARERLMNGNEAPEIILPDVNGELLALSSLRGKVVLIDFWAAWCPPCRQENPQLVKVYNKFKHKGFEIYGVSLDRNREDWLKAIREDKLPWLQVSDLKFWNSPVVSLYNVEGIPFTVLLDKQGRIIAKGLRHRELEQKLREILG